MAKVQSEMKDVQIPKERSRGLDDIDDEDEVKPVKKAESKPRHHHKIVKK